MYTVNWCEWEEIINEKFVSLIDNTDRYLILYGSRGSSKSNFTAKKLIYRCLTEDYFRYILIRNEYNKIQDSSYKEIKDCVEELGLTELFTFNTSPLRITCINGNSFIARGCDDPASLKSIKDPTGVWWEEDIPREEDFKIITKSIRTSKAPYLQEVFTVNPEVEGDYSKNWFFQRFFTGHYPDKLTFTDTQEIDIDGEIIRLSYTCHHSTVDDNRWATNEYKALLSSEKDGHRYRIDRLGLWSTKITGGNIYKYFNSSKHTAELRYNPNLPLHISWDENVNPYLPCGIFQIEGKEIRMIDLILGRNPDNTIKAVCNEFKRRYPRHTAGLFVYGDATSQKEDVKIEKGYDLFDLIIKELRDYSPKRRVSPSNPSVITRVDFFNAVLDHNEGGLSFLIDKKLSDAVTDFEQTKEAPDGRKAKITVRDENTKVTYQPFGHITDLSDYLLCEAFSKEYDQYQTGGRGDVPFIAGVQSVRESSRY